MSAPIQASTRNSGDTVQSEGFRQCITAGCEQHGLLVAIPMVVDVVRMRATDIPVTMTETQHAHPLEDSDAVCPDCGQPAALMREKPPKYRPWR